MAQNTPTKLEVRSSALSYALEYSRSGGPGMIATSVKNLIEYAREIEEFLSE